MAKITNFNTRITDLAGTLSTLDPDAIEQWALDGCYDVVRKVKMSKIDDVHRFCLETSAGTGTIAVNLDEKHSVLSVERDGVVARYINPSQRNKVTDVNSMYYANEASDPIWYVYNGILAIKPNPASSSFYYHIPEYAITDFNHLSNPSTITDFPPDYYEHICLYAAIEVLKRRLLDLDGELPESIMMPTVPMLPTPPTEPEHGTTSYELPEMPVLDLPGLSLDTGSTKPGAMYWLEVEEDTELLSSALSIMDKQITAYDKDVERATKQFERDKMIYEKEISKLEKNADWRESKIGRDVGMYSTNLQKYTNELTAFNNSVTKMQNEVASLDKIFTQDKDMVKQEYDWIVGRTQLLIAKYQGLFGMTASNNKEN